MKKLHYLLFAILLGGFVASCTTEDYVIGDEEEIPLGDYTHGLFILNEGNMGSGNSEISFIDQFYSEVSNNIFKQANAGATLGDTAQSIGIYKDLAFIVVNNSNKIVVVNRHTFEKIATIEEGINNPRYITFYNDKAYVTNWGDPNDTTDDYIAFIDIEKMEAVKFIPIDFGPEKIISDNRYVYVAHKGAYSTNNKLSIIDVNTNLVIKKIEVGDIPNSMQIANNNLWVLAGGNESYTPGGETDGKLTRIDLASLEIINEFDFVGTSPSNLEFDNGNLYYTIASTDWETYKTETNVYSMKVSSQSLPTESIFFTDKSFYGSTIKDGKLFGGDAKDYASAGSVYIYDLDTGDELVEFKVGISPSGLFFTE